MGATKMTKQKNIPKIFQFAKYYVTHPDKVEKTFLTKQAGILDILQQYPGITGGLLGGLLGKLLFSDSRIMPLLLSLAGLVGGHYYGGRLFGTPTSSSGEEGQQSGYTDIPLPVAKAVSQAVLSPTPTADIAAETLLDEQRINLIAGQLGVDPEDLKAEIKEMLKLNPETKKKIAYNVKRELLGYDTEDKLKEDIYKNFVGYLDYLNKLQLHERERILKDLYKKYRESTQDSLVSIEDFAKNLPHYITQENLKQYIYSNYRHNVLDYLYALKRTKDKRLAQKYLQELRKREGLYMAQQGVKQLLNLENYLRGQGIDEYKLYNTGGKNYFYLDTWSTDKRYLPVNPSANIAVGLGQLPQKVYQHYVLRQALAPIVKRLFPGKYNKDYWDWWGMYQAEPSFLERTTSYYPIGGNKYRTAAVHFNKMLKGYTPLKYKIYNQQ